MLLSFEFTLFAYLMIACVFWLIRRSSEDAALLWLVGCNSLLLFSASLVIFLYAAAQFALVFVLYLLTRRSSGRLASALPWLAFIGLIPLNFRGLLGSQRDVALPAILWWTGGSFLVIKSFVVLKEALREKSFPHLRALAALTFVPSYPAGPIFGAQIFRKENIAPSLTPAAATQIFLQIGWGAAALYIIAPYVYRQAARMPDTIIGGIGSMYLKFAGLFFDFSGYSILAIAMGAFFGLSLPQNFNRPYLATSLQDFWQRWHMSLSAFIGTYLFKPFVRQTGSPRIGIFLAFVCAGLWHKFSLGYLLWGIGHGAGLSVVMRPPQWWLTFSARLPLVARQLLGWAMTMTWVALLSLVANKGFR